MANRPSLTVGYYKRLPKGCPKCDVIRLRIISSEGKKSEVWMRIDEASLIAAELSGAVTAALWDKGAMDG